jgi:hypothetical protein
MKDVTVNLRCPSCGEEAGRPILWGMPDFDTQERVESGELDVIYGGCSVPEEPANAGCRVCDHRWLVSDQRGEVIDANVGGGPWGPRYSIRSDGQQVAWEGTEGDATTISYVDPGPDAWAQFWAAVEEAGAWGWEARYDAPGVLDGTSWSLHLAHEGRALDASGSNAWPPGFETVQGALEALARQTWR